MSTTTKHNNEISETNGMLETDNELLIIDWQKSGQGIVIFRFKILHEEENRIFNQTAYLSNFQKRR